MIVFWILFVGKHNIENYISCWNGSEIQLEALKTLKYKDEEALQKMNDRKSITTSGSYNNATQKLYLDLQFVNMEIL